MIMMPLARAQDIELSESAFADNNADSHSTQRQIRLADRLYARGGQAKMEALSLYLDAYALDPGNSRLNYRIGKIFLEKPDPIKALEFINRSIKLGNKEKEAIFHLARGHHLNSAFEDAIALYQEFRETLGPEELNARRREIEKLILECRYGISIMQQAIRVFVDPLPGNVNSAYDDYLPLLHPGDQILYFTSRRPLSQRARKDRNDGKYIESTLMAIPDEDSWLLKGQADGIFRSRTHLAPVSVSQDGNTMILYRGDKGGDLYISNRSNEKWLGPKPMRRVNSRNQESSAAISSDGRTLYFISDRSGGYGGTDIWVSYLSDKGKWSEPINAGPVLNTEFDEQGLYLKDDYTLYFSSRGHNSMGGFDVFKSEFRNGRWTNPINLGHPINTPSDELFFSFADDDRFALFSSKRPQGGGVSNLYLATFLGPEKPLRFPVNQDLIAARHRTVRGELLDATPQQSRQMTLLKGRVFDEGSGKPIQGNIELYDNEEELLLASFLSNPDDGSFFISMPGGRNYGMAVISDGYLFHSENINISESDVYREIIYNIPLKPIEIGNAIVLNNIFFDFNSANLRPESYAELGILFKLLTDNPTLRIKISGHTDNVGSPTYNETLSRERARSVVNFLINRGIDPHRLRFEGYGFSRPVASNDTEEGRQLNRRTEFEIIEK